MASTANYASTVIASAVLLQAGDSSRVAPINAQTIFTPGGGGALCERIIAMPVGPCVATPLRVFRYDSVNYNLVAELQLNAGASATSSAIGPQTMQAVDYPQWFPIECPIGSTLVATINDTQTATEMSINSVALNQTTGGAAQLSLNGALPGLIAASTAAISALATQGGAAALTLTSTPYVMPNTAQVTLTSTGNISAVNFTITGRSKAGALISEVLAGPNNNTVYSTKAYAVILSVVCSAAVGTNTSVGYSAYAPFVMPTKIILSSIANLSATNFTIKGLDASGALISEVLAGPNVNTVQSVSSYAAILTIATSGAVVTNVSVGNPDILSGYKVHGTGGGF